MNLGRRATLVPKSTKVKIGDRLRRIGSNESTTGDSTVSCRRLPEQEFDGEMKGSFEVRRTKPFEKKKSFHIESIWSIVGKGMILWRKYRTVLIVLRKKQAQNSRIGNVWKIGKLHHSQGTESQLTMNNLRKNTHKQRKRRSWSLTASSATQRRVQNQRRSSFIATQGLTIRDFI